MAKQSNTKVSSGDEVADPINNQLQHTPTPQVPDYLSYTKKELTAQLQAYNVSVSQDKTKDALANQLLQHFITNILPGLVQNHDGYLHYNIGLALLGTQTPLQRKISGEGQYYWPIRVHS
jgi:hypothetical protein